MNLKFNLVISFLLLWGSAIYAQNGSGQLLNQTITVDGIERSYLLYVPSDYDASEAYPLVFNLHGLGSNNLEQNFVTNFGPIADTAHFLLVLPQALPNANQATEWNIFQDPSRADDVKFISSLIDSLNQEYTINLSKVYCTGFSNGSVMSLLLACVLSDRLAAVGSASATGLAAVAPSFCTPERPMPILYMHGTADLILPFNGGRSILPEIEDELPPVRNEVNFWVANNACDSTPEVTRLPDINTADSSQVIIERYGGCEANTEVLFYITENGGHTWAGGPPSPAGLEALFGNVNRDFNASEVVWNFFSRHQLPSNEASIKQFVLVNADTDQDITMIEEGASYNFVSLGTSNLGIRVETIPNKVGSLSLELTGPLGFRKTENIAPYALFGNNGADIFGRQFLLGEYTLTATPFSKINGQGIPGNSQSISFQIVSPPEITGFTLINADTDQTLQSLEEGAEVDLGAINSSINIVAETNENLTQSVVFELRDSGGQLIQKQTESFVPFALFGDQPQGAFNPWSPANGSYTLIATPYTNRQAQGDAGATVTLNFTVIGSTTEDRESFMIYPNPSKEQLKLMLPTTGDVIQIRLRNHLGEEVYQTEVSGAVSEFKLDMKALHLGEGRYFIEIESAGKKQVFQHIFEY